MYFQFEVIKITSQITGNYKHTTVLIRESIEVLSPRAGGILVDCTLGGGGHTRLMLEAVGDHGKVIAFDRDIAAIDKARQEFSNEIQAGRLILCHNAFGDILLTLSNLGVTKNIDGILADIGVSSHHLDEAARGFSFSYEGPLDMRMDQSRGQSAAEFLATASETEIADVIYKYGEESKSRFIAKLICERRHMNPFKTTKALADLIASKVFWKEASRRHPATRTFQALRIYINDELGELEKLLAATPKVLKLGGVLAIITFHSLEDRIAKSTMLDLSGKSQRQSIPRDLPLTTDQIAAMSQPHAEVIRPFPMTPSEDEIRNNPRARSAKLRAIRLIKESL